MIYCSAPQKEDTLLIEAAQIHNEALALAKQLEKQLDQLANDTTYLKDSLNTWRMAIEEWERNLVEVPGNESSDHHPHDHHDHGKKMPELTSGQMLSVQLELKSQLDDIKSRINAKRI
jgi:hypothetical protein